MAIRYDKDFNKEIQRVVKNFNAKVMRLEGVERMLAPDTILVSDLKKEYTRRSDLKRRLKELELFSERGAEKEVNIGKWHTNQYNVTLEKRRNAVAKRNITRELKQMENSPRLKNMDYKINLERRREFLKRPINQLSEKLLEARLKVVATESNPSKKSETLRKNLFAMIYKTAYTVGVDPKVVTNILSKLNSMSTAEIVDAFLNSPALKNFHTKYELMQELMSDEGNNQVLKALEDLADDIDNIVEDFSNN